MIFEYTGAFVSIKGPLLLFTYGVNAAKHTDHIQTGDANYGIYDAGQKSHLAKEKGDQIKLEEAYKSPVDGSDDDEKQNKIIQRF